MSKLSWAVKQLLPLTYWTRYEQSGEHRFVIWRMWFGRCFDVTDVRII